MSAKLIPERADDKFAEFANAVGSAAPANGTDSIVEVTVLS
jgi:hypothetical protein